MNKRALKQNSSSPLPLLSLLSPSFRRRPKSSKKTQEQQKNRKEQTHINQKGFIISLLLISLPLFISCLMIFTSLIFCIRNHDLTQSFCLKHTLQAQEQIKKSLKDLLNLNPLANHLRQTQKRLERLYKEALKAGEPIIIATLRAKIEIIKQKRILLDRKQHYILQGTIQHVEWAFLSFKKDIMKMRPGHIQKNHYQPFPLAVKAQPPGDIAPSYYPVMNFPFHQSLSFSWKMPLYQFLPKWLVQAFFQNDLSDYACSSTIKKHKLKWKTFFN